jgi:hypothetical protein
VGVIPGYLLGCVRWRAWHAHGIIKLSLIHDDMKTTTVIPAQAAIQRL